MFSSTHGYKSDSYMACILPHTSIQRQNIVSCNYVIFICRSGGQVCEEVWRMVYCVLISLVMS